MALKVMKGNKKVLGCRFTGQPSMILSKIHASVAPETDSTEYMQLGRVLWPKRKS